jgi:hypothetical protein
MNPSLFPLTLPTIYPHLSINSRLCEVCPYLSFGVSMSSPPLPWFFVQPALLWVKELRMVRSWTTFLIVHSLLASYNLPQQPLGIDCIRFPRPYEFYDIRSGGRLVARYPWASSVRFDNAYFGRDDQIDGWGRTSMHI